ncbi:MAG: BRcat domain-containing protein [Candidatus Poseidoniaceae archaeon]
MTDEKKSKFAPLYFLGLAMFFFGGDLEILVFLGMFTIFFTSLAHLIVKIVTLQEGFTAGSPVNHQQARRPMFSSQRPRGNPSYDQLIRKMQVSDLSGMSVAQAASTYASFFKYPAVSAEPFFSNPYVKEVLNIGATQVSAQAIAGSGSSNSPATSSSSGAFWSSMPESSTEAIEVCANPTCSTPVTVFDFRCFKCRNRFCSGCKGSGVTCQQCS